MGQSRYTILHKGLQKTAHKSWLFPAQIEILQPLGNKSHPLRTEPEQQTAISDRGLIPHALQKTAYTDKQVLSPESARVHHCHKSEAVPLFFCRKAFVMPDKNDRLQRQTQPHALPDIPAALESRSAIVSGHPKVFHPYPQQSILPYVFNLTSFLQK